MLESLVRLASIRLARAGSHLLHLRELHLRMPLTQRALSPPMRELYGGSLATSCGGTEVTSPSLDCCASITGCPPCSNTSNPEHRENSNSLVQIFKSNCASQAIFVSRPPASKNKIIALPAHGKQDNEATTKPLPRCGTCYQSLDWPSAGVSSQNIISNRIIFD